jgi:hypothetical protein
VYGEPFEKTDKDQYYIQLRKVYRELVSTRWRGWLRHYAISQKAADSIRDEVTGIFDLILSAALWPRDDPVSNTNE